MQANEVMQLRDLFRDEDWNSVYSLLDRAKSQAVTREDFSREAYWRAVAFERQGRFEEALDLLRRNASLFNCQCLVQKMLASILVKLGHYRQALEELSKAPIEEEMQAFYGSAIDAKFLYFYLLAKCGDRFIQDRLAEIPDDYRHFAGGKFLTKPDIVALMNRG